MEELTGAKTRGEGDQIEVTSGINFLSGREGRRNDYPNHPGNRIGIVLLKVQQFYGPRTIFSFHKSAKTD